MDERSLLGQLEELARGLGIEVRYEMLKREGAFTQGGLCRLKGQYLLLVNSKAANRDKIEALAVAVNRFDLSQVFMKPGLRDFLARLPKEEATPLIPASQILPQETPEQPN
ncbi:MAG: hypothetical protein ACM34H_11190 [Deltaproteobacteria bacterium]